MYDKIENPKETKFIQHLEYFIRIIMSQCYHDYQTNCPSNCNAEFGSKSILKNKNIK